MEVYFEDLEDKLDQIISDIQILSEQIDSVEDAFKSMIDIKTNFVIKVLTIFSAFMLPLTLVTSFYGMNVNNLPLPNVEFAFVFMFISIFGMTGIYLYFKKKGKF
jgi:magnesium transporter